MEEPATTSSPAASSRGPAKRPVKRKRSVGSTSAASSKGNEEAAEAVEVMDLSAARAMSDQREVERAVRAEDGKDDEAPADKEAEEKETQADEEDDLEDLESSSTDPDDYEGMTAGLVDDGSSDDSEDDAPRNRIGNIPLEWYEDEDHVGYDIAGEKIMKTLNTSEIDALLESKDNPMAWRTIKDHKNQREIVLTDTDLEVIRRLRLRMYPSLGTDHEEMVEFENKDAAIHPVKGDHPPKRRFIPSKWEGMKVKRLVALMREGKIRPPPPPKPEVWDLWADEPPKKRHRPLAALPAPKMAMPSHADSYNPPQEFLFTEEEKKEWEEQDETDRNVTHIPQQFEALRKVPAYQELIAERFKRCLDLYLVPRALKRKFNVDPQSLLPKLPSPKDLRPFPTHISVSYEGHSLLVRGVAVEPTGQWIATVSSDCTLRIWEVATGRPYRVITFPEATTAVAWNPIHLMLTVACDQAIYFLDPGMTPKDPPPAEGADAVEAEGAAKKKGKKGEEGDDDEDDEDDEDEEGEKKKKAEKPPPSLEELMTLKQRFQGEEEVTAAKAKVVVWKAVDPESSLYKQGCRLWLSTDNDVQQLTWHVKGNYVAAVSPKAISPSNGVIIHALQQQKSMRPFARLKHGWSVQAAAFHPSKPHFFVATKYYVRIFDLQKQVPLKKLTTSARWIGSLSVHPGGDNIVVGSYCRKMSWFDLDFASEPYKTLQYHDKAVRRVAFHQGKYPLLAACSDDATVSILHAKVFSDLMESPMIIPVKRLRDHMVNQGLGVLDCVWHPEQPWLFTAGADGRVYLWA